MGFTVGAHNLNDGRLIVEYNQEAADNTNGKSCYIDQSITFLSENIPQCSNKIITDH